MLGRFLLAIFLLFVGWFPAHAQIHTDFSGTWKLNLRKSDYGDLQGPDTRTDVIRQRGDRVSEIVTAEGRHRKQRFDMVFATNGSQTALPPGTRLGTVAILSVSARWDSSNLILTQHLLFQGDPIVATNTYSLSADGKTLRIALALGDDGTAATFVFDLVPAGPTNRRR